LVEQLEADQTHISERRFLKVAEPILKISNLGEHRLFEVIKEACLDTSLQTNSNFLLVNNWNLLVDLFKYIPSREITSMFNPSTVVSEKRNRRTAAATPRNKDLMKLLDYFDAKNETKKNHNRTVLSPEPKSEFKLQSHIKELGANLTMAFEKASEAFKAFDQRKLGHLMFSDFMAGIYDYKLAGTEFNKELILQIFTFLDTDKDNRLKYADFCSLYS
jgi:EF-hand domain pair